TLFSLLVQTRRSGSGNCSAPRAYGGISMGKVRFLSPPLLVVVLAVAVSFGAASVTDWYAGVMVGCWVLRLFTAYFRSSAQDTGPTKT
ncbi:MAG: hypothetical protein KDB47_14310, partial [Mycobacterium sp.]|nr:hypothetical protein [Mycobacterium sp.]